MTSVTLYFSDSSSDSEEEGLQELIRYRRQLRDHLNPLEMDTKKFVLNFRMTKEAFIAILDKVKPHLAPGLHARKVPCILKMALTLRFCAQGSYQLAVGNEGSFGVAQPTVSKVLSEMLDVMERILCPEFIKNEISEAEVEEANRFFFMKCGIPGVMAVVDGTHIKLIAPRKNIQHLYYNRKGFYSINAMIVCDHKMRIRHVNGSHPGSNHDSMVFEHSSLKLDLEGQYEEGLRNRWLLGDAGYALRPYLMTPFRNAQPGTIQCLYNTQHAKGRNIIERVIGVFKSRWRCMLGARALHYTPEKATQIINVCAALHNICIFYNIPFDDAESVSLGDEVPHINHNVETNTQQGEAEAIRLQIARSLYQRNTHS